MPAQGLPGKFPINSAGKVGGGGGGEAGLDLYIQGAAVRVRASTLNALPITGTDTDIAASDGLKLWVEATTDADGIATAAAIASGADYPDPTPTTGIQPLGALSVVGDVVFLPPALVRGALGHHMCNGAHEFWPMLAGAGA